MATATYTKTGAKASTAATLPKEVFSVEVTNHELLKVAYNAYLDNARTNNAVTKLRGQVRGGGRKPWKQKGTGRARAGSIRSPLWKGGGVTFGPSGNENYSTKISKSAKRTATKQALTLANKDGNISVIETFECKDGKTAPTVALLKKIGANRRTLIVVSEKDELVDRATRNVTDVKAVQAKYMNVYDIMNAHHIIISEKSIDIITEWLSGGKK